MLRLSSLGLSQYYPHCLSFGTGCVGVEPGGRVGGGWGWHTVGLLGITVMVMNPEAGPPRTGHEWKLVGGLGGVGVCELDSGREHLVILL